MKRGGFLIKIYNADCAHAQIHIELNKHEEVWLPLIKFIMHIVRMRRFTNELSEHEEGVAFSDKLCTCADSRASELNEHEDGWLPLIKIVRMRRFTCELNKYEEDGFL
jgi:hypothetical protein